VVKQSNFSLSIWFQLIHSRPSVNGIHAACAASNSGLARACLHPTWQQLSASKIPLFSGVDQFMHFFSAFFTNSPLLSWLFLLRPEAALGGALVALLPEVFLLLGSSSLQLLAKETCDR
jgi:hypothetical protein